MTWLQTFDRYIIASSPGFPYRGHAPRAVLWHTTEGWRAEDAFKVYRDLGEACPHITAEYAGAPPSSTARAVTRRRFQHVPLDLASYALQHGDATHHCAVETNASGIIQIERVGFAADVLSDAELQWFGEQVLAPILETVVLPWARLGVYQGPRMSEAEWDSWQGGQARHRDAPCQPAGHTDPGDLNLDAILEYALRALDKKETSAMPDYIIRNGHDAGQPWLAVYPDSALR